MLGILLASLVFELPTLGPPLPAEIVEELNLLPGVARAVSEENLLRVEVTPGAAVRYEDITRTIRDHTVRTVIDVDRVPLGRHTVFQMDAGQCFYCSEKPLRTRLGRKDWLQDWSVVAYAPKGRMLFRIVPRDTQYLEALGALPYEDILFTDRYDGVEKVELDWPTGGVQWRESEEAARAEAVKARKPLLFFPTAGT